MPDPAGITFRPATPADDPRLRALLDEAALPSADVASGRQELIVAARGDAIVGAIGLELLGEVALLRSFVVEGSLRGAGVGRALYDRCLVLARARRARGLYLLTTTAEAFFAKVGWTRADRKTAPPAVAASTEFASLCPSTAVFMVLPVAGRANGV
jgi:amino-acid N-acetyltransferase